MHLNQENMRRIVKKLFIFYSIFAVCEATYVVLTYFFWNSDAANEDVLQWKLNFSQVIPAAIVSMFGLFNVWIQCFNKQISR